MNLRASRFDGHRRLCALEDLALQHPCFDRLTPRSVIRAVSNGLHDVECSPGAVVDPAFCLPSTFGREAVAEWRESVVQDGLGRVAAESVEEAGVFRPARQGATG